MALFTTNAEPLTLRKVFLLLVRRWYLLPLFLGAGLSIAAIINRYSDKIYMVESQVLINKEMQSSDELLTDLFELSKSRSSIDLYRFAAEMKNPTLVKEVSERLRLNYSLYQQGDVKVSEIFPRVELDITWRGNCYPMTTDGAVITFVDSTTFTLAPVDQPEGTKVITCVYGQPCSFGGCTLVVGKIPGVTRFGGFMGGSLLFKVKNASSEGMELANQAKLSWRGNTNSIMAISLPTSSPTKAAAFIDSLLLAFQRTNLEKKNTELTRTIDFINGQLEIMADSLDKIEGRIKSFNDQTGYFEKDGTSEQSLASLIELNSQLFEISFQKRYLEYVLDQVKHPESKGELMAPASVGLEYEALSSKLEEFVQLQLEREALSRTTTEANPYLQAMESRLIDLRSSIVSTTNNLLGSLTLQQEGLTSRISQLRSELSILPEMEWQIMNLDRVYDISESIYMMMLEKRSEASIMKASTTADFEPLAPASFSQPIEPNTQLNYTLSIAFSLAALLLVLVVFELLNNKVRYAEEAIELSNLPLLGVVGHNDEVTNLVVSKSPKSRMAESFRSLRTNLSFFLPAEKKGKMVLITSSVSGEGKTFCAENLSLIYAYSDYKVCIVGGDMRKPRIFSDLEEADGAPKGLSSVLSGAASLEESLQKSEFDNLDYLPAGPVPPNPAELLLKPDLGKALEQLRSKYDIVIIDSPPLGIVTDAMLFLKYVDHTIYVARHGFSPKSGLATVRDLHETGKLGSTSLLLNDLRRSWLSRLGMDSSYYGYYYGGYGSYGYTGSGYYVD